MIRRSLLAMSLVLISIPAIAEVVVRYVDGDVEVRETNRWALLENGSVLSESDTVRLEVGAYLELESGSAVLRLSRAGTYRVATLIEARHRSERAGTGAVLATRVARLLGRAHEVPQTVAMGVRGPAAESPDVAAMVEAGALLEEGNALEAKELLADAYVNLESRANLPAMAYMLGIASALLDNTGEAIAWLELVGPDPRTEFFADHAVLLAHLLVETFAFREAVRVLEDLRDLEPDAAVEPGPALLYAVALAETGNRIGAERELERLLNGPNRESAQRLLTELRQGAR